MKKVLSGLVLVSVLFGFNNIQNSSNYDVSGKVIRAYKQAGYGRMAREWLFMDIKTKNGVRQIAIAPTFRISNLDIKEGDEVKISGFIPPMWVGVIKACDIYDITQKRDYPICGGYNRSKGVRE